MAERLVRRLETTKLMKGLSDGLWSDVRHAREQGKKVCWTFGPVPFEPLRAMDIPFQHLESYGARVAARQAHGELKEVAHACGYSRDMCSYARITHGRRILEQRGEIHRMNPDVVYPTPDFVAAIYSCPTQILVADNFARNYNVPAFIFELPFWSEQSEMETVRKYFRRQMDEFILFLEEMTGRPFDYDRMRQLMVNTKKAAELRWECIQLCKAIPSPMTVFDQFISLGPIHGLRGTPQSVDYYEKLLAEVKDRVAKKIGAVPEEKYRLYWDNLAIWFKVGALSEKLASLKANIVISSYSHHPWRYPEMVNPDEPIQSIVDQFVAVWASWTLAHSMDEITKLVEEYSLDGLLMHSSHTCRPHDIGQFDIMDVVGRRTGVPGLMIDADPTDPDFYSDAQVNSRLEAFMETLAARKKRMGS
ncbi:MAG: 2-hydroxyacyl-CoA dehydratase family protein [Chloroflexota bacterium]